MDNILQYIINLIVVIPIILILIVSSIKLSKMSLGNMSNNRYTKVLERTNLSKDTDLFVIKIGDEGCVLVSSPSKVEKIKELNKEDIELIEMSKQKPKLSINNNISLDDLRLSNLNTSIFRGNINGFKINTNKSSIKKLKFGGGKYGRIR